MRLEVTDVEDVNGSPELVCHPKKAYPALVTSGMLATLFPDFTVTDIVEELSPTKAPLFGSNVIV